MRNDLPRSHAEDDPSRSYGRDVRANIDDRELPHWQDVGSLILGILLFIAPWILRTAAHGTSSWNAWIVGTVSALFGLAALNLGRNAQIPEWCLFLLGVWLFLSPWILGFGALNAAAWPAWIIGALLALTNGWRLRQLYTTNYEFSS
ncbi:MAG TPA: SPW repeat protein [Ktedonobacteraceae bacterium]|jgi:hypothetical protein|nr:SPW repeat protein [Ktedonobacteraceae bacterium]